MHGEGKNVPTRGRKANLPKTRTVEIGNVQVAFPIFNERHRGRLDQLGVPKHTVERLEALLLHIQTAITPGPRLRDQEERLDEIEKLTKELQKKLRSKGLALNLISSSNFGRQLAVWRRRSDEAFKVGGKPPKFDGYSYIDDKLVPVLNGLLEHVEGARQMMPPKKIGRPSTASEYPIELIHRALMENAWQLPSIPVYVTPSKAENHPFREIVGICYEAAGSANEPLKALYAFLAAERKKRDRFDAQLADF